MWGISVVNLSVLQQPALVQLLPTACKAGCTLLQRRGCLVVCRFVELLLVQPSPLWLQLLLHSAPQDCQIERQDNGGTVANPRTAPAPDDPKARLLLDARWCFSISGLQKPFTVKTACITRCFE